MKALPTSVVLVEYEGSYLIPIKPFMIAFVFSDFTKDSHNRGEVMASEPNT
jgi:hypothetical protein